MKIIMFYVLLVMLAFSTAGNCICPPDHNIVVMIEKVVVTSGDQGMPHKGSVPPLYVSVSGRTLFFGSDYSGCALTVSQNGITLLNTFVDENGFATLPEGTLGVVEMDLTVGPVVYWAEFSL